MGRAFQLLIQTDPPSTQIAMECCAMKLSIRIRINSIPIDIFPRSKVGPESLSLLDSLGLVEGKFLTPYALLNPRTIHTLTITRICPGRHLASNSVWISIASILATFEISKAKDANGKEIHPDPEFTTGIVWYVP